jgi:3-hydroxy-3-methylglutaryl CoA synthase
LEDLGIPELTSDQIEELCTIAEEAARKYIHSKLDKKSIETLTVCTEVEGTKPVNLKVDVDIELSPSMESFNVQKLANEAVKEAFRGAEKYLRGLTCHTQK